jgi:hypothetical protein
MLRKDLVVQLEKRFGLVMELVNTVESMDGRHNRSDSRDVVHRPRRHSSVAI